MTGGLDLVDPDLETVGADPGHEIGKGHDLGPDPRGKSSLYVYLEQEEE